MPTNIDREALLNALHECIDGDMLIDGDGEAVGLREAGAADVVRWAADALTSAMEAAVASAVKRHVTQLVKEKAAAVDAARAEGYREHAEVSHEALRASYNAGYLKGQADAEATP